MRIPSGSLGSTSTKFVDVLTDAEPTDKAELYNQLGVSLRYDPAGIGITVESNKVGGGTWTGEVVEVIPGSGGDHYRVGGKRRAGDDLLPQQRRTLGPQH